MMADGGPLLVVRTEWSLSGMSRVDRSCTRCGLPAVISHLHAKLVIAPRS